MLCRLGLHNWRMGDKWQDGNKAYWEFYCTRCIEVRIKEEEIGCDAPSVDTIE